MKHAVHFSVEVKCYHGIVIGHFFWGGVLLSNFPTVFSFFLFFSPQKAKKTKWQPEIAYTQCRPLLSSDQYSFYLAEGCRLSCLGGLVTCRDGMPVEDGHTSQY